MHVLSPVRVAIAAVFALSLSQAAFAQVQSSPVSLGPRPFYLVDQLVDGPLKEKLQQCQGDLMQPSDFSIGHRGAALQFPEHTKESYEAAARMGAGILECDVTFTADGELVCRHAECDLHTTTNILETPLASTCDQGFTPATFDASGNLLTPASATCCASDLTLAEFKTLCGKMDASNPNATTVEQYLDGTTDYRTDLYATCGTVLSLAESIVLFESVGAKHTPELKSGDPANVAAVFGSQEDYAQAMIGAFRKAGVQPDRVWAQSFNLDDVLYWLANEPTFGAQAVFLDDSVIPLPNPNVWLDDLAAQGVNIVAPPMPQLLTVRNGDIAPSKYALAAKAAGLDIISWSVERSGRIQEDVLLGDSYYYQTTTSALANDGDILRTIDVLAQDVGIIGLFSDWPATTTYYANCFGIFPN
jgi:glycerophosphoryl diester phosphodiesterase